MTGGYITHHNAEAVEAFFGPFDHDNHVKLYHTHKQVLNMERVNREMSEVLKSGKLFPVVFE